MRARSLSRLLGPRIRVVRIGLGCLVAQVACPHHLECLSAVEVHAGRRLLVEARTHGLVAVRSATCRGPVEYRHREGHIDTSQGLHDVGELVEVERDGVLDRDPEVLFDGRHDLAEAVVQASIDFVGSCVARVGDEEIPRNREQCQAVVGGVRVENHDHVAVDPGDSLGTQAVGGVLNRQCAARGRPHHQDVFGASLLPGMKGRVETVHRDPLQVVGQVVQVAGAGRYQHEDSNQPEDDPHPPALPPPGRRVTCPRPATSAVSISVPSALSPESASSGGGCGMSELSSAIARQLIPLATTDSRRGSASAWRLAVRARSAIKCR